MAGTLGLSHNVRVKTSLKPIQNKPLVRLVLAPTRVSVSQSWETDSCLATQADSVRLEAPTMETVNFRCVVTPCRLVNGTNVRTNVLHPPSACQSVTLHHVTFLFSPHCRLFSSRHWLLLSCSHLACVTPGFFGTLFYHYPFSSSWYTL